MEAEVEKSGMAKRRDRKMAPAFKRNGWDLF